MLKLQPRDALSREVLHKALLATDPLPKPMGDVINDRFGRDLSAPMFPANIFDPIWVRWENGCEDQSVKHVRRRGAWWGGRAGGREGWPSTYLPSPPPPPPQVNPEVTTFDDYFKKGEAAAVCGGG